MAIHRGRVERCVILRGCEEIGQECHPERRARDLGGGPLCSCEREAPAQIPRSTLGMTHRVTPELQTVLPRILQSLRMMTPPLAAANPQSLPREQRIAQRRDFLAIYAAGRKEFGRHAVVFVQPNELSHPRIGITVTKKAGKSHVRNRLRRWCREIFRTERGPSGLESLSLDLVINVKPSAASATFADFSVDLGRVLRRCAAKLP